MVFGQYSSAKITYKFIYEDEPYEFNNTNKSAQEYINSLSKSLLTYSGRIKYTLLFNNGLAKYSLKEGLHFENDLGLENAKNLTGATERIFLDSQQKLKLKQIDFFGDKIIVKLPFYDEWNITQEKRKIGSYTCYKAWQKNKRGILVIAWFTPEIPLNLGPKGYGNLPGLIIELRQASLSFTAEEIVLNPKDTPLIELPKLNRVITQEEFENTLIDFDKKRRN